MPRIPALTLGGGKLSQFGGLKAAREFRVWCHPRSGGDDFYYAYKTLDGARRGYNRHKRNKSLIRVEPPCAVVYDKRYRKYREVVIDKASLTKGRKVSV